MEEILGYAERAAEARSLFGIPDTEDGVWDSSTSSILGGCFRNDFPDMFITFGGYFRELMDGRFVGMVTDILGTAIIVGKIDWVAGKLSFIKTYSVATSNMTCEDSIRYDLRRDDLDEWTGRYTTEDGSVTGEVKRLRVVRCKP